MKESIFSSIVSYTPTAYIDPQENFLTELFAWILNNVQGFALEYISLLNNRIENIPIVEENATIRAKTQTTVTNGYIDMVIYTDSGINYICEHKVDSELSENQINKYLECRDELEEQGVYYSVLLTRAKWQHTQKADVSITWSDVDMLVDSIIGNYSEDPVNSFVLEQFSLFLREKGLGKVEPMNAEYFKSNYLQERKNVAKNEEVLKNVFREIAQYDWKTIVPGLDTFTIDEKYNPSYAPKFKSPEYGRVGINFFLNWEPGIFAGILFDGYDHKLELCDESKGPDFVVIMDVTMKYNEALNSEEWTKAMKQRLINNHSPFDKFVDNPKNKWRLAVLQRPFYDVIKDARTLDEQKELITESIKQGIELFIRQ